MMVTSSAAAQVREDLYLNKTRTTNFQTLGTEELVRTRCSTDGSNIYTQWQGFIYAFVPQEKPQKLFNIIGMNVARCQKNKQGKWFMTSRELSLYLDPRTNQVLNNWKNSWTGETVPVVHVANNPVQNSLEGKYPITVNGSNVTFSLDIPLIYPNDLASNSKFKDYSPEPFLQGGEFFTFTVPIKNVTDSSKTQAPLVAATWTRFGPWLPWMKMKGKPGQLVYTTTVRKFQNFNELFPSLQQVILSKVPVYREAPKCILAVENETSWTYFSKNFNSYLKSARFPVPETKNDPPCE